MGFGQWGQRPWQLQLRRLHEFNLDAIDIECNGTRIGAMVFGKVQFHIGHHVQQRQQRRTTSCHNRFTSFVHHIAYGHIGIGTAGRRHRRISTRSQFEFDMAGFAAYRWVCQFKYSIRMQKLRSIAQQKLNFFHVELLFTKCFHIFFLHWQWCGRPNRRIFKILHGLRMVWGDRSAIRLATVWWMQPQWWNWHESGRRCPSNSDVKLMRRH